MSGKNVILSKKGILLLALLENNLLKEDDINEEFWNKYDRAWDMFEQMTNEKKEMREAEISIVG